ncbi:MAG TPA: hypothetical protein VFA58_07355 [Chthoniobacterales bacterium]|nr:hypothetical protein [Chthoniobacterales bacterium]
MIESYALRYIGRVMGWPFDIENRETTWLRSISNFKYDNYHDFRAGSRFAEGLLNWLQQFDPADRQTAYDFVRRKLIFISTIEMQHLVNRTFPVYARKVIASRVAQKNNVPLYLIWGREQTRRSYKETLERTLFLALSDGARIDAFRRANAGVIANDQVAVGIELSKEKWQDLHANLKERTKTDSARFNVLFLIDDFTGSGKTLLRKEGSQWKGKLTKLAQNYSEQRELFATDCTIAIHHYISTQQAAQYIAEMFITASKDGPASWFPNIVSASHDLNFGSDIKIARGKSVSFDSLVDKYYDAAVETPSIKVGGTDVKFGFAACGLPVVLEHNTPNNSIGLLWAESPVGGSKVAHKMRPLFRRRQRHT